MELRKTHNVKEFKQRILSLIRSLGFDDYAFINLDCTGIKQISLNTFPAKMIKKYFEQFMHTDDMVLERAISDSTPFFSSTIYNSVAQLPFNNRMTETMERIDRLYQAFGYYDIYCIPCRTKSGKFLLSVAKRHCVPTEFQNIALEARRSLMLLSTDVAHATTEKYPQLLPHKKKVSINKKPLKILSALANDDMSISELAERLCISYVTAHHHLADARKSFEVNTNHGAIKKAIMAQLITYYD